MQPHQQRVVDEKKELDDKRVTLSIASNSNKESKDADKGIVRNCEIA